MGKINLWISLTYLVCINKRSRSVPWYYLSQTIGTNWGCWLENVQYLILHVCWLSWFDLTSAACSLALCDWTSPGVVCSVGWVQRGLAGGVDYGGKPQYPCFGQRGEAGARLGSAYGGGASRGSCLRSILINAPGSGATSGSCACVPAVLPLCLVLTHISHTSAIPVWSWYSCHPPATAHKCFLLLQKWLIWASVQKDVF